MKKRYYLKNDYLEELNDQSSSYEMSSIPFSSLFLKDFNLTFINKNLKKEKIMLATYKLKASEIDQSVIDTIKNLFKDREIEIIIHEVKDETEYLLKSTNNKTQLLTAISNVENKKHLEEFTVEGI